MDEFPNDSIREIICNHVFYSLTVIFIGITVFYGTPSNIWAIIGCPVMFLVVASIVMAGLSASYALKCHYAVKVANELRQRLIDKDKKEEELDEKERQELL